MHLLLLALIFTLAAPGFFTHAFAKIPTPKNSLPPEILKKLTPEQYRVTQECATENPFNNAYWNHKEPGIYVDVVSGEALFSSLDKFDSGTGWPSFTRPIDETTVVTSEDRSGGMKRTEVKSKTGQSHLGHVFDDGPGPSGKRYCINSASLRFVHVLDLEKEGFSRYLKLFPKEVIEAERKKRTKKPNLK